MRRLACYYHAFFFIPTYLLLSLKPTASNSDIFNNTESDRIYPDFEKVCVVLQNRGKRAKYDGIPPNELEMLKSELGPLVSMALKGLLFDTDFKKHCTAADMISGAVESLYPEIICSLDLIFR